MQENGSPVLAVKQFTACIKRACRRESRSREEDNQHTARSGNVEREGEGEEAFTVGKSKRLRLNCGGENSEARDSLKRSTYMNQDFDVDL